MPTRLIGGLIGGAVVGAAFGYVGGNTIIGILICAAAGTIAAYLWERSERSQSHG